MRFFVLIFSLCITVNALAQWEICKPSQLDTYSDITFLNEKVGFMCGGNSISKTTDGGQTFSACFSGNVSLEKIVFLDEQNAIAIGFDYTSLKSVIIRTSDGGNLWYPQLLPFEAFLNDVCLIKNSSTAYILGNMGLESFIFKSTDYGYSWQQEFTYEGAILQSASFVNDQKGFVVGGNPGAPLILRTTDGGNSWTKLRAPANDFLQTVCFPSEKIGYITGWSGDILKTVDGGQNWFPQIGMTDYAILDAQFLSEEIGFIAGGTNILGGIQKTTDGGQSWTSLDIPVKEGIKAISFLNENHGFAAGHSIIKTQNTEEKGILADVEVIVNLYPNPFLDEVIVSVTDQSHIESLSIDIYDANGNEVYGASKVNDKEHSIDLSHISAGTYILKLHSGDKTMIRKIIKG